MICGLIGKALIGAAHARYAWRHSTWRERAGLLRVWAGWMAACANGRGRSAVSEDSLPDGYVDRTALPWTYCPLCGVEAPRPGMHKDGCPAHQEGAHARFVDGVDCHALAGKMRALVAAHIDNGVSGE